jgi:hypothetical protein
VNAGESQAELLEPTRDVHSPRLVAEVPPDLSDDRGDCVTCEIHSTVDVEAVDGLDEPDRADLNEILERFPSTGVAGR